MTAAVFQVAAFAVSAFIAVAGAVGVATTMSMFRSGMFLMASFVGTAALFLLLSADLLGLLQVMMYLGGMLVMVLFMVLFMHDPGGAMMASMEGLAPPERWFSRGLVPRARDMDEGAHGGHGDGHDPRHASHGAHHARPGGHGSHQAAHGEGTMEHGTGHGGEMGGGHQGGGMDMADMSMVTPVRPFAAWLAAVSGALLGAMLLLRPAWRTVAGLPEPDSARAVGELLMGKYMVAFEGAGLLILVGIFGAVLLVRPSAFPDDPSRAGRAAVYAPPEPVTEEGLAPAVSHRDDSHRDKENGA